MVSPSRKEKEDLNIPAQTQGVQAMVPTRVNIQQHVTEQASFPRSHNPISSDNQVPTGLPPFDKEKLLAMQARVLQGRLQYVYDDLVVMSLCCGAGEGSCVF